MISHTVSVRRRVCLLTLLGLYWFDMHVWLYTRASVHDFMHGLKCIWHMAVFLYMAVRVCVIADEYD